MVEKEKKLPSATTSAPKKKAIPSNSSPIYIVYTVCIVRTQCIDRVAGGLKIVILATCGGCYNR